jgi:hypothetical protein
VEACEKKREILGGGGGIRFSLPFFAPPSSGVECPTRDDHADREPVVGHQRLVVLLVRDEHVLSRVQRLCFRPRHRGKKRRV